MSVRRVLVLMLTLCSALPIWAQGLGTIRKVEYVIQIENINRDARLAIAESNKQKDARLKRKEEELLQEKLIRDRKVELDIQLAIDSAAIEKREVDMEQLRQEKANRLQASQRQYESDLKRAKDQAQHTAYSPPDQDMRYSATFLDDKFSTDTWVDIFVEAEAGVVPLDSTLYFPRVKKSFLQKDGLLELRFTTGEYGEWMDIPVGLRVIVFYCKL